MKTLFEDSTCAEVMERLDRLTPASAALWGKMNVAQAMAHCVVAMEMATGDLRTKRMLIGRVLGPLFRGQVLNEKPMARNSPTDPAFVVADARELDVERGRLKAIVQRFHDDGAAGCTTAPHSFFGAFTPEEWARQTYKHLDHHLRQFGV